MPMLDRYMTHKLEREIDLRLYRQLATASLSEVREMVAAAADPKSSAIDDLGHWHCMIHRAALNPDLEVLKYLVSLGIDPCQLDFWGREPLSFAVRSNGKAHAEYLIALGNRADNEDCDGGTVIAEAALNPSVEVLDLLFKHGANPNAGAMYEGPLAIAVSRGSPDRVQYFIAHGADISYVDGLAAYDAPIENLRALLKGGYDANQLDEVGGDRVIDHLDDERRALFEEFGGVVLNPKAEKYHLTMV